MLTVVHCLSPAPVGGLESVVRLLATGQLRRGYRVTVAVVSDIADHPFVQALQDSGIDVIQLRVAAREYGRERSAMKELLRNLDADILHTHGYRPDILDIGVGRRCGAGTVTTLHGFTGGDWKVRLYERIQTLAIRKADAIVAVSQGVRDRVLGSGVRKKKVHLIPNAYASTTPFLTRKEARRVLGIGSEGFHIGWIGRLSLEKGTDVMMEALGHLRDSPITLSFIGDGPDRTRLEAHAEGLDLEDRTIFHGIIPNVARLLPAFDAFVLSSRTEGAPIVILEAMASGTPIVATRVGGVPDMLSDTEAELVVPENPEALAMGIQRVIKDPLLAAERATRARERLHSQFGLEQWLSQYESLYQAIKR